MIRFGQEYLELFPNGKARTAISNYINQAKADLPAKKPAAGAAAGAAVSIERKA